MYYTDEEEVERRLRRRHLLQDFLPTHWEIGDIAFFLVTSKSKNLHGTFSTLIQPISSHPRFLPIFAFILAYSQLSFYVFSRGSYTYHNTFCFDTNRIPSYKSVTHKTRREYQRFLYRFLRLKPSVQNTPENCGGNLSDLHTNSYVDHSPSKQPRKVLLFIIR